VSDRPTQGERDIHLEGQTSGEGGIRVADAAISTQHLGGTPTHDGWENLKVLDRDGATALLGMTRAMYPHDRVPDEHYARVVLTLDEKAAADEQTKALLVEGIGSLATMTGRWPQEFGSLDEAEQVKALKRLQYTAFFKTVAGEVVNGLYSQHDIWPYFGYEGPSNDKGGYLERGFDDIDWLDEAPDNRGKRVARAFFDEREGVETEQRLTTGEG